MKTRIAFVLLLIASRGLVAQEPIDSGAARAAQLRQQIRQRWNEQVRRQLNLTDDQAVRLQAPRIDSSSSAGKSSAAAGGIAALRTAATGVEADADSAPAPDAREQNRAAIAQLERDETRRPRPTCLRCSVRAISFCASDCRSELPRCAGNGGDGWARRTPDRGGATGPQIAAIFPGGPSGGTGRRAGLKIRWGQPHVSSILSSGTSKAV